MDQAPSYCRDLRSLRQHVSKWGGTFRFTSEVGEGLRFEITLPVIDVEHYVRALGKKKS